MVGCSLNLDLTNATLGMYAVALQIEDFTDQNYTYAMSSVNLKLKGNLRIPEVVATKTRSYQRIFESLNCIYRQ